MRFASFIKAFLAAAVMMAPALASAQVQTQTKVNPHTQIRWPAPSCLAAGFYSPSSNTCLGAYTTIKNAGAALPSRPAINWLSGIVSCVDNAGTTSTDCNLSSSGVAPAAYTNPTLSVDSYGRVTSASSNPFYSLAIGTITTGAPGSPATVTITGTPPTQTISFSIPSGLVGGSLSYPNVTTDGDSGLIVQKKITAGTVAAGGALPTSIGSTGVTFPDGSIQATKATSSNGNGLSVAQTLNASGTVLFMVGDSTFTNYLGVLSDMQGLANTGQPLSGMQFVSVAGAYTCSGSNFVLPISNSSGLFVAGTVFGTGGNGTTTGSLPTYSLVSNYWVTASATASTVTATPQGGGAVACTTGGTIAGGPGFLASPNVVVAGFSGQKIEGITTILSSSIIPLMQADAALGMSPVLVLREGINNVRVSNEPFAAMLAATKTQVNTVLTASGLGNIPVIWIGQESLNSVPTGGGYICPTGTPTTGVCNNNTSLASISAPVTASTPATVLLTNPSGQSFCPTDMWGGPGMPVVTSSQGNNFTAVLDTVGSGVQETVTVTALAPTITNSTTWTCTLSFTPANSHFSGAPIISTKAWAAQSASDQLWMLANAVQGLGFPTLRTLQTQGTLVTRNASTTVLQPGMADNLHLTGGARIPEDYAIAALVTPAVTQPLVASNPQAMQSYINPTGGWSWPEVVKATTSLDPAYNPYAESITLSSGINGANYWHPWAAGPPAYLMGCEDPTLFDTVSFGISRGYTGGSTSFDIQLLARLPNIFTGLQSDEIAIPGYGCYSGQISSVNSAAIYHTTITLASGAVIPTIPAGTPIFVQRYKSYASAGLPYLNSPAAYPWHRKVILQGTLGVSAATFTAGNAGSGFTTGDTVTFACQITNFVGTVTASAGAVTAIAVTTGGNGCVSAYGIPPLSTSGAGTGLLVNLTSNGSFQVVQLPSTYWTPTGSSFGKNFVLCAGNEQGCVTLPSTVSCAAWNAGSSTVLNCIDSGTVIGTNYLKYIGVPVDVFAQVAPDVEAQNVEAMAACIHDPNYPTSGYGYMGCLTFAGGNRNSIILPADNGTIALVLKGTTGSIGGSALTAGTCATGTASVSGANTGMMASSSPVTYPGAAYTWSAYVSSANTVTVSVCTNLAAGGTPTASAYNVRVIQ